MDITVLADTFSAVAAATVTLFTGLGVVYAFFRKRIKRWWAPYRAGIEGAARVPHLESSVGELRGSINLLHLRIGARANHSDVAECDFDTQRRMLSVNATMAKALGVGKTDLLGYGYVNHIHPDDRDRFREEWKRCTDEHRVFEAACRWLTVDRDVLPMHWVMTPIPEALEQPIQQWLGVGEFEGDPA